MVPHDADDSQAPDQRCWERTIDQLAAGRLLLIDRGFTTYPIFDRLTTHGVTYSTRRKSTAPPAVVQLLQRTAPVQDDVIRMGRGSGAGTHPMRGIAVL